MKNRILVFGRGFIGERIRAKLNTELSDRRILTIDDAEKEIKRFNPKVIINCIGHTGKHNIDECEIDKDKTLFSNTFVPFILAEVALRREIKLVHISSGCIYHFTYGKQRPITENRIPDFFDLYYSRTKIYAERALEVLSNKYNILIVRIRIPLDNHPHPRNILTKLINYRKVLDIPNSVTYIPEFIDALRHLIKIDAHGIFNVVNKNGLRYPDLLEVYKKYVPNFQYQIINYRKLGLRRTNLILSVKKLEDSGFIMRSIKDVLDECVKEYLK